MTKKITQAMMLVVLCAVAVSAYFLPYVQEAYGLSPLQKLSLAVILVICGGMAAMGAVEYNMSLPLSEFLKRLERDWEKYGAFKIPANSLDGERLAILQTITRITLAEAAQIKEFEHSAGISDAYKRLFMTVSHQLRTPITGLKWALSIIDQNVAEGTGPDPKLIAGASEATARIGIIVEQLLKSLGTQSTAMPSFGTVDIEQCIDHVVKESALLAARQNMRISVVRQSPLIPLVRGKELEIGFVMQNLVTNALYYGAAGGTVTITLAHENNRVGIAVHNAGRIIPENEKALLFSEFHRSSEAIRLNPDGSGLALYLTRQIIIDHGGTISCASSDGRGTVFTVTLPISSQGQLETSINY